MQSLVFSEVQAPLAYKQSELPDPAENQVVVALKAAALNHRDNWILKGQYPGLKANVILGSDGAGMINGRQVIINPNVGWGANPRVPNATYTILGMPQNGTFAEKIVIGSDRLVDKPTHLTLQEAAALPLAGLTAYRALFTRCRLESGERVLISGVGGGVALMAFQFALAAGAEVWVTSSSEEKIARAVEMGAVAGANYTVTNWDKDLRKRAGGFDVIIDSAAGDGFAKLVNLTNPAARIGVYGGTRGNMNNIRTPTLFFRQIDILGSTMGNDDEFIEMVKFVQEKKIVPVVDSVFALSDGNDAIGRMNSGLQFGKIILDTSR